MNVKEFVKHEKEKLDEYRRLNYSKKLCDIKDRRTNRFFSDEIRELKVLLRSLYNLERSLPIERLNKFLCIGKTHCTYLIPYVTIDSTFDTNTYEAIVAVLTNLNSGFVTDLRMQKYKISGDDYIANGCISHDISNAKIEDISNISKIIIKLEDELMVEKINEAYKQERENAEKKIELEYTVSKINELKALCKPNGTDFKIVNNDGVTNIMLNGDILPKTRNRSEEFHNGYIEGYRRAIVMMQVIMGFPMYDKEKDKKKEVKKEEVVVQKQVSQKSKKKSNCKRRNRGKKK
jgi:hypothetical protein